MNVRRSMMRRRFYPEEDFVVALAVLMALSLCLVSAFAEAAETDAEAAEHLIAVPEDACRCIVGNEDLIRAVAD